MKLELSIKKSENYLADDIHYFIENNEICTVEYDLKDSGYEYKISLLPLCDEDYNNFFALSKSLIEEFEDQ